MRYFVAFGAALAVSWIAPVGGCLRAQESLERAMLQQAPRLVKLLQQRSYRNVGVLKFLVNREGEDTFTDKVGTLNLLLARRLELALILANDPRKPVGIIEDASAVAQKTPGATHLTKEGRLELFGATYRLAWGDERVRADAFVTGLASISKDLKRLTISLLLVDGKTNKVEPVPGEFTAANRADQLAEMGESFVLRGFFDDGKAETTAPDNPQQKKILEQTAQVHEGKKEHPARQADAPVVMEVHYDGHVVPYEIRDGKAYIPEPQQGQKVQLVLKRDGSKERYGVVLKVNGENTIDKQKLPELSCRKWVLDPGCPPAEVNGYLMDNRETIQFRVLSPRESRAKEIDYGPDVGMITMTVFREAKKEAVAGLGGEKEKVLTMLAPPKEPAKNFHALKAQLLDDVNRGVIGEGDKVETKANVVPFRPDPRPVMVLTVVYYKR